jgi:hypothetical protein
MAWMGVSQLGYKKARSGVHNASITSLLKQKKSPDTKVAGANSMFLIISFQLSCSSSTIAGINSIDRFGYTPLHPYQPLQGGGLRREVPLHHTLCA